MNDLCHMMGETQRGPTSDVRRGGTRAKTKYKYRTCRSRSVDESRSQRAAEPRTRRKRRDLRHVMAKRGNETVGGYWILIFVFDISVRGSTIELTSSRKQNAKTKTEKQEKLENVEGYKVLSLLEKNGSEPRAPVCCCINRRLFQSVLVAAAFLGSRRSGLSR